MLGDQYLVAGAGYVDDTGVGTGLQLGDEDGRARLQADLLDASAALPDDYTRHLRRRQDGNRSRLEIISICRRL